MNVDKRILRASSLRWLTLVILSLCSLGRIACLAPRASPVRRGSSDLFWRIACGVSLNPSVKNVRGSAFLLDNDTFGYEISSTSRDSIWLRGSDLYYLPKDEALAVFPRVVEKLEEARAGGVDSYFVRGFGSWEAEGDRAHSARLVTLIRQQRLYELSNSDGYRYARIVMDDERVARRWSRSKSYWATILFEWWLITGLAAIALWPWIRQLSPLRWCIHWALMPTLLMMPAYFGYATDTFTSSIRSGGIWYPELVAWFSSGSVNSVDSWILIRLPWILEPISPEGGYPLAKTAFGMEGPTGTILMGLMLGLAVLSFRLAWILMREKIDPRKLRIQQWLALAIGRNSTT